LLASVSFKKSSGSAEKVNTPNGIYLIDDRAVNLKYKMKQDETMTYRTKRLKYENCISEVIAGM
jgi:hypothetical protein